MVIVYETNEVQAEDDGDDVDDVDDDDNKVRWDDLEVSNASPQCMNSPNKSITARFRHTQNYKNNTARFQDGHAEVIRSCSPLAPITTTTTTTADGTTRSPCCNYHQDLR